MIKSLFISFSLFSFPFFPFFSPLAQTDNQGTTDATAILDAASNGSQLVVKSFDNDWQQLVSGSSPVYTAVVAISLSSSAILIAFWGIGWFREVTTYGLSWKIIDQMTWPVIVALLIGVNNGAVLANTSLLFRGISNYMNAQILDITRNGVTLRSAIRETNMNQALAQALKIKFQQCEQLPAASTDPDSGAVINPRQECQKRESESAQRAAREYREANQIPSYPLTLDPSKLVGQVLNSAVQGILYFIFSGLSAGFQYILQLSFLLAAYSGPVFVALSLLPIGTKPIYAWLSGWFSLGLILVSYSITVGMAASSIVNAEASNPLFLPLIEGILSPLLAVGIGLGGGLALFSGFTSAAAFLAGRI